MSLHTLANHLQSAGRGEDKVLVHMTPGEVKGLQSIAMAHGGSLTINPETGLPEAGFLRSILPMIAGFALGPAGLGMTAMNASLASAALGTVLTGDLKQGIMAGIGAYGGAGMGAGLMSQGAQGAAGAVDDVALASKNAAANSQIGAGYNTIAPQTQVFGQPPVSAATTTAPNMGLSAYNPPAPAITTAPTVYPPGHPLYTPAQSQINLANQAFTPTASVPTTTATTTATPTVETLGGGQTLDPMRYGRPDSAWIDKLDSGAPNAFTRGDPTSALRAPYKNVSESILAQKPATASGVSELDALRARVNPSALSGAKTYPDLSTLEPGGSWAQTGTGRYTITNPSAATSSTGVPIEVRNVPAGGRVIRSEILPGDPALAQPQSITGPFRDRMAQVGRGFEASTKDFEGLKGLYNAMPTGSVIASGITLAEAMKPEDLKPKEDKSLIRPYEFDYGSANVSGEPYSGSAERTYFNPVFTAKTPYRAPGPEYAAEGGLMGFAVGGPVEQMAAMNAVGANTGYPQAGLQTPTYSNPAMQRPQATNVIAPSADAGVDTYTGEPRFAAGGISTLGGYSDGGRLLRGPGDGVSDSIPASIGNRQPARLADGEFVVPARIVSEIGNGSTEAGARKLYAMMDRVQKARRKTVGKNQVARNTKAEKLLPA